MPYMPKNPNWFDQQLYTYNLKFILIFMLLYFIVVQLELEYLESLELQT